MVGKRSGKALLREEGLQRTDNNLELTAWPQVSMINQKNYYTEYLKRDDQILPLRTLQDERRSRLTEHAKDKDRARAQGQDDADGDVTMDMDEEGNMDENEEDEEDQDVLGGKVIVLHPGSQNLRVALASDAIPKTVPMVIARKWSKNESEEGNSEPLPKRQRLEDGFYSEPEKLFGQEFATQYGKMCQELKVQMRANKRRVLPNSKELVVNYNTRIQGETIDEHNDPLRIDWTEVPKNPKDAPEYYCGHQALRIPDHSNPRYRLFWPLRRGWYNEGDYKNKMYMYQDIAVIIEEAIKSQLNMKKKDFQQYKCVFVIPDLYDRNYVTQVLEMLIKDFEFNKVCFVQESLAATFGAAFTAACVVDIGAQKTSIACVEEGMVIDNSRVNIKIGGADVTDTFMRMMLYDHFPYQEINLKRRFDLLLADELKEKFCTMNGNDISVQLYDFHVRAPDEATQKFTFKTYDECLLAPQGLFQPSIFDHSGKLSGRRKLIGPSYDLYDGSANDPSSSAQSEIIQQIAPAPEPSTSKQDSNGTGAMSTPSRQIPNPLARVVDSEFPSSATGTPAPDDGDTPAPAGGEHGGSAGPALLPCHRDDVLPIIGLDRAILTSVIHGARGDERKTRDFLGGIMVIGGGAQIPGFLNALEERLKVLQPSYAKEIMIGPPPRELDPQGVVWKGASVFGKLRSTGDMWIGGLEFDRLGARCLAYKCLWGW